jgi:hypothetical protein
MNLKTCDWKEMATVNKVTDVCHSKFQGSSMFICGDKSYGLAQDILSVVTGLFIIFLQQNGIHKKRGKLRPSTTSHGMEILVSMKSKLICNTDIWLLFDIVHFEEYFANTSTELFVLLVSR